VEVLQVSWDGDEQLAETSSAFHGLAQGAYGASMTANPERAASVGWS
jgi:hypothetical protein